MKAAFRYFFFGILLIPILPVLYWQGRRVKSKVPSLPEARDPSGTTIPPIARTDEVVHVLLLGESTIAGVGVERHADGIAGALANSISTDFGVGVEWQVIARNGYNVRQVREKLLTQYSGSAPDLIIAGLGGNDAFELTNPISWRMNIRKLIGDIRVRFPDVPILFLSMPPIKDFPAFPALMKRIIGSLVEMLGEVLLQEVRHHPNVHFQQPSTVVAGDWLERSDRPLSIRDLFSDGVHPSPLTYRLWGAAVGKFILEQRILRL